MLFSFALMIRLIAFLKPGPPYVATLEKIVSVQFIMYKMLLMRAVLKKVIILARPRTCYGGRCYISLIPAGSGATLFEGKRQTKIARDQKHPVSVSLTPAHFLIASVISVTSLFTHWSMPSLPPCQNTLALIKTRYV